MNDLQLFDNPEFGKIRVVTIDGEAWFVGKDVAIALGYSNPRDALTRHVPDKFKRESGITTPYGVQKAIVINEAGMYKLVLRSKLPNAEKFSDWACEEVLPSIRKTGAYVNRSVAISPDFLRRIADEMEARDRKIAELQPKAAYCDKILQSDEALAVSIIAQDYGMSAMAFNRLLAERGIQHRVGRTWIINYPYAKLGYTISKIYEHGAGGTVTHTYWTQKGRFFLYNVLRKSGVLPTIEREEAYAPFLPKEGVS